MPRSVHRTPRHLDDPLRILGLTPGQWGLTLLGLTLLWLAFRLLPGVVPGRFRLSLGVLLGGLPLALSFTGTGGRALAQWPRRFVHFVTTPADRIPAPPRRGPLRYELYDGQRHEEDPPDA